MEHTQLENVRDRWIQVFFEGDYENLAQYEDENFKVVYEQDGRTESHYTRYQVMLNAVQNGVWKPRKMDVVAEEFEFLEDNKLCKVLISLENTAQKVQELWMYKDQWKVIELRFLKP